MLPIVILGNNFFIVAYSHILGNDFEILWPKNKEIVAYNITHDHLDHD